MMKTNDNMPLNDVLSARGFSTRPRPGALEGKEILDTNGQCVFAGTADDVWTWLHVGDSLRAEYLRRVNAMIERYPKQEAQRASYEEWANEAQPAVLTHAFRSKGGLNHLQRGTLVLYARNRVWAVASRDNMTSQSDNVRPPKRMDLNK